MSDLHVSFTIPGWGGWVLVGYLALGLVAAPVCALALDRRYRDRDPRKALLNLLRPTTVLAVVLWPLAVWGVVEDGQLVTARRRRIATARCEARDHVEDGWDSEPRVPCLSCRTWARKPWWTRRRTR